MDTISRLKVPLRNLRDQFAGHRQCKSIETHKSTLNRKQAKDFARYLSLCQKAFNENMPAQKWVLDARDEFLKSGFTSIQQPTANEIALKFLNRIRNIERSDSSFWENTHGQRDIHKIFPEIFLVFETVIEPFLQSIYQSHYKIFYGKLEKVTGSDNPRRNSQLWHTDGGPGTCTNIMYYISEASQERGALELVPWDNSLPILKSEVLTNRKAQKLEQAVRKAGRPLTKSEVRAVRCEFMAEEISLNCSEHIVQPHGGNGLIVPFLNNTLHRGGYPSRGKRRYVFIIHCYPAMRPTPYSHYLKVGIEKRTGIPIDPGEER